MKQGFLVLEDKTSFSGFLLNDFEGAAEVVFNTSHGGYEEIATDPSYYGQMIVMSAPMQGNYGVDSSSWESNNFWIRGFIAYDLKQRQTDWVDLLQKNNVPAMTAVDTRQLVMHLREKGTLKGAIVAAESVDDALVKAELLLLDTQKMSMDWVHEVTSNKPQVCDGASSSGPKVALIDYGYKRNILRELLKRCSQVCIFPSRTSAEDILAWGPDGILLSNGPGDPANVEVAVDVIKELFGKKVMFGICMGSQLMGRALGADTYPLKFGHHGSNHPVKDLRSEKVYMTSQNHGYALSESMGEGTEVIHRNLNDNTVAGIMNKAKKCFSVQFHPENSPGPRDATSLFDEFVDWVKNDV